MRASRLAWLTVFLVPLALELAGITRATVLNLAKQAGIEVIEHGYFRVTRDADFNVSDEADDLLQAVEDELRRRRFGEVVRVEVGSGIRKADAGAKEYDDDVKKQAQQLGLSGW